jgi:hypothetical protein
MTNPRIQRVQFNKTLVTPDTASALRQLEKRAERLTGTRLSINGPDPAQMNWEAIRTKNAGPTGLPPEWSAVPTGREVYLNLEILDDKEPAQSRIERQLAMLWGIAVPLGFTPFSRYPLPGTTMGVFHFMGPWDILMDHMLGAGRGEAAWAGFCGAAQADVGAWEGGKQTERFVQSHLHRIGYNAGAIDGVLGNATLASMKAAGFSGMPLTEAAESIGKRGVPPRRQPRKAVEGTMEIPDTDFSIVSYGQVRTARTPKGAVLSISGPGRIVVDVRDTA